MLQNIFCPVNKSSKLDIKLLTLVSNDQDYRSLIDLVLILEKVLLTGSKGLSIRKVIADSVNSFKSKDKISLVGLEQEEGLSKNINTDS